MPILNYTTTIDPAKTVGEIVAMLVKAGATQVGIDYHDQEPVSVRFLLRAGEQQLLFRLPANSEGVLRALKRTKQKGVYSRHRTPEQARRVAWRIVKDWLEAQLAIIEAEVAAAEQVFLPYAVTPDGRTVFEHFKHDPTRLLGMDGSANSP